MNRRDFLKVGAVGLSPALVAGQARASMDTGQGAGAAHHVAKPFDLEECSIAQLRAAIRSGRETFLSITKKFLARIHEIDQSGPSLRSVIEVNPDALAMAEGCDQIRKHHGMMGPLHGIPVLLKDNIDTQDRMMTTAGSLALVGSRPHRNSTVAQQLYLAGAVILGKTNLSEWANFRGDRSSSGWSGRGGQTRNPYALDRNPSGSSSGSAVAVAANLCVIAVGTETDGSIISPSAVCGVVGIKPTVGLIGRGGIIPISRTQDTAGPIARTVMDAAILLGGLTGIDLRDETTKLNRDKVHSDYTQFLTPNGLRGARIGVARRYFRAGTVSANVLEGALEAMRKLGAELIDPVDDPPLGRFGDAEDIVLHYEFKDGINRYLKSLNAGAPVETLEDLIAFNEKNKDKELQFFGQQAFIKAQAKGPLTDKTYLDALEKCRRISRAEGIDAIMDKHQLDAIVAPSGGPAGTTDLIYGDRGEIGGSSSPAAVAGYPNITVPAGNVMGMPVGISFFGRAYSEPILLRLAFAFEQGTMHRMVPKFLPTIG